jgi:hypothetical protein
MAAVEGIIWWDTPTVTVALLVVDGDLVDCPPDARPLVDGLFSPGWPGHSAVDLWREADRLGIVPHWIAAPRHTVVGRWWNGTFGGMVRRDVWLRANGWTWQVGWRSGRRDGVLCFRTEDDARRQVELLLSDGGPYRRIT